MSVITTSEGKLIVFYGINNLGKSTQAKRLVEHMNQKGIKTEYLKYGIYDLRPSGPILNDYLRSGNPYNLTAREFQLLHVINRTQYQSVLQEKLASGISVVAEDYASTGIAWGVGSGVDKDLLIELNVHLLKEHLSLYFTGKRFSSGIESGHKHEQDNELTAKVDLVHAELAETFNWKKIAANQTQDEVFANVWKEVAQLYQ